MDSRLLFLFAFIYGILVAFAALTYQSNKYCIRAIDQITLTVSKSRFDNDPPLPLGRSKSLPLGRADWKETHNAHEITLDVPGFKREDVKIEVEETGNLRVLGKRKADNEAAVGKNGDKWHHTERSSENFFLRLFRLPVNADMGGVEARLGNGVLRITVPKLTEEKVKQPKLVNIVEGVVDEGDQDIITTEAASPVD